MRNAYDLPGASMLMVEMPNANSLTAGIVGDPSPAIRGTDPASAARDSLAAYWPGDPQAQNALVPGISGPKQGFFDMTSTGRAFMFSLLALLLVAFGLWVLVKQ